MVCAQALISISIVSFMTYETSAGFQIPEQYYAILFEALAGNNVLVRTDTPKFTILAASPGYLKQTNYTKEAIIGKGIFEAFPGSPDPDNTGVRELLASLNHVLEYKEPHQLPVQRYDTASEDGRFVERYWRASNKPVFAPDGQVAYIIHSAEDITEQVISAQKQKQMEGIEKAYHLFMQVPAIISITKGAEHILELANEGALRLWGTGSEIIGKPLVSALPEVEGRGMIDRFNEVLNTGKPFLANEVLVTTYRTGAREDLYFDVVYQPYFELDNSKPSGVFAISHDVTEVVKAKRKVEESEEKYRTLFESMDQGYCTLEILFDGQQCVDYRYLETNPTFERHLGMSNALGKTIREIAPDIEPKWFDFYGGVALTGNSIRIEEESKAFNKWFEVYAIRIGSAEERRVGVFFTDVTNRKKTEASLEESEAKFRTMAESTPVLIAVADETGNATYFNKAWTDITGRPMKGLLQMGWFDLVHPDDRDRYLNLYLDAFNLREPFTGEFRVLNPKGDYCWLLADGVPRYTTDGSFVGYISACTDITEHKLGQQQLQTALEQVRLSKEAAELGTFDMNLEKGNLHWDKRCRTLFGISHQDPVSFDMDFVKRLHPEDRERVVNVVNRAFDKSLSNGDYDVEYRTIGADDGIIRWVRAKGKVYFNEQEKPVRFIGSVLDITDQVTAIQKIEGLVEERTKELAQANEALHQVNKELRRSNANLEEFAHAASHDLKEPVRKILVFTNQLKHQLSNQLEDGQAKVFKRIESATERMGILIDDLLLYSHVSQRPHEKESVDLKVKVQRVLEDLELEIDEKKAVIHVGKLPIVKGYGRQLQQLFQNLVSNAIKYSRTELHPRIDINSSLVIENEKSYHRIAVEDNGIGFDLKYTEKIFQMFTRLHARSEYSGTGVGLSIVKRVVENHNGFIRVESKLGQGSTFSIHIPEEE